MEYNITLSLMQYVLVLVAFGIIGSCFQAYKGTGDIRPFFARVVTGSFAGAITMLVVYKLGIETESPVLHWGVATVLGAVLEKKDKDNIMEKFVLAFSKGGRL